MSGTINENLYVVRSHPADKTEQEFESSLERRGLYLLCKRVFDVLISSLTIIFILSWLLPILAILIRLDSRGPAFFVQRRVGFLGKSFFCIKLRTMIVNAVCDHQQATSNDPRITRLGKFLRITSLDELPQFFNVLIGDMSIVGPRPHMLRDNEDFGSVVSNYRFRLYVKPGITGIAQLKGCRGPAKNFHSIFHRYQWDAFYIRNANIALDFKIIRLTAIQIFRSMFFFKSAKGQNEPGLVRETSGWALAKSASSGE